MLTQKLVSELFNYNPETGAFTWKVARSNRVKQGDAAGSVHPLGYLTLNINGKNYYAHRIAWLYVYGTLPETIDHVNHNRKDNRIFNLRDVTRKDNQKNQRLRNTNTSGVCGVYWNKRKRKWHAQIVVDGVNKSLGYFDDLSDAAEKRKLGEAQYAFHPNHGAAA